MVPCPVDLSIDWLGAWQLASWGEQAEQRECEGDTSHGLRHVIMEVPFYHLCCFLLLKQVTKGGQLPRGRVSGDVGISGSIGEACSVSPQVLKNHVGANFLVAAV